MANLLMETEEVVEGRVVYIAERPIPFERFLDMAEGRYVELVDGVIVEKPMVQLDHERCSAWLYQVLGPYVEERDLGQMLSSRIMVQADAFGGRMPDLLYVRKERMEIVQQKAVYGAPDLVIEIISPNDRPSDLRALEADYDRLGVVELVFIDLRRQSIRLLRKQEAHYEETVITSGPLTLHSLDGLNLPSEWILQEPRPGVRATLNALFPSS
jgi:Uma2 family endonuclease